MDFFETLLGMSPDGGNGTAEAMWVGAIALAVVAYFSRRRVVAWIAVRTK